MSDQVTQVRNHWWWRQGWRTGRHFYACHLTLDDQPALRSLVAQGQAAMSGLPMLDLIPGEWLHVTMQGIGFVDEIGPSDLAKVRENLIKHLGALKPPVVTFQHTTIRPEAVYLKAQPGKVLYGVRQQMHSAVLAALGSERFPEQMPQADGFTPHVSAAYVNAASPAEPIAQALASVNPQPVTVTFAHASLLEFHRDHRMYEWTSATPIPFARDT